MTLGILLIELAKFVVVLGAFFAGLRLVKVLRSPR